MTFTRRILLSAAGLPVLAGCASSTRRPEMRNTSASTSPGGSVLETPLGRVDLGGPGREAWTGTTRLAAGRVAAVWGRSSRPIRVVVCATAEEFESVTTDLDGDTAAVTVPGGVYLGPNLQTTLTRAGQQAVVAHELTHARLGHDGTDSTARWVKEGAAEWTAQYGAEVSPRTLWPTLAQQRGASAPVGPPAADDFVAHTALSYESAAAYVSYLADIWGVPRVRGFVEQRPDEAAAARMVASVRADASVSFSTWLGRRLGT